MTRMQFNRCMKCMKEIEGYPCPGCGYAGEAQPEFALKQGAVLNGKYVVGCVLGQGGFGLTYVGWDLALETKVAIKEYFPSGSVSRSTATGSKVIWFTTETAAELRRDGMEAFLREARKMAKIDRIPGAVRVRDVFLANETAYIVMDYAEGETLKSLLQRKGPMNWAAAEKIFLPALQTLSQVHKAGIIHRDISPDNLMIAPDGSVQLLDLGAAKDLSSGNDLHSMPVAKFGFSPYEQYIHQGSTGPWSDVYAIGATIYNAVTGKVPQSAVDRMARDTLDWEDPRLKALPDNVLAALKKALQLRAKDRYQRADEFLTALKKEPIPPQPNYLLPILAAAVVVLLAVCGFLLFRKGNSTARLTAPETETTVPAETAAVPETKAVSEPDDVQIGSAHTDHVWDDGTVITPAGHLSDGEMKYTCTVCGLTRSEKINGELHAYEQQVAEDRYLKSRAACESPAVYYKSCSCGEMGSETFTYGNPTGHSWQPDAADPHTFVCQCEKTITISAELRIYRKTPEGRAVTFAAGQKDVIQAAAGEYLALQISVNNGAVETPIYFGFEEDNSEAEISARSGELIYDDVLSASAILKREKAAKAALYVRFAEEHYPIDELLIPAVEHVGLENLRVEAEPVIVDLTGNYVGPFSPDHALSENEKLSLRIRVYDPTTVSLSYDSITFTLTDPDGYVIDSWTEAAIGISGQSPKVRSFHSASGSAAATMIAAYYHDLPALAAGSYILNWQAGEAGASVPFELAGKVLLSLTTGVTKLHTSNAFDTAKISDGNFTTNGSYRYEKSDKLALCFRVEVNDGRTSVSIPGEAIQISIGVGDERSEYAAHAYELASLAPGYCGYIVLELHPIQEDFWTLPSFAVECLTLQILAEDGTVLQEFELGYNYSTEDLCKAWNIEYPMPTKVPADDTAETQPAATQPAATQPAETQPAATQPAATQPAATQPAETQPTETQPVATQPAATQPAATQPAATQPTEYTTCPEPSEVYPGDDSSWDPWVSWDPDDTETVGIQYVDPPADAE